MQKLLTIYKFNIPFIDEEFETIKYDSILEDLEKLFLYEEEFKDKKTTIRNNFTTTIFNLKNYKAEIVIYTAEELSSTEGFNPLNNLEDKKQNINYFIPKLKFTFYSKNNTKSDKILKSIFDIFISTGRKNYIFDYNNQYLNIINSNEVLTLEKLKKSLDKYSFNYLNNFLTNTNKEYMGEKIMNNKILRNCFYYIIYLCFEFYKNLLKTKNGKEEIKKILSNQNIKRYIAPLKLTQTRLNTIEQNTLINFINYKNILDKLFSLLKIKQR